MRLTEQRASFAASLVVNRLKRTASAMRWHISLFTITESSGMYFAMPNRKRIIDFKHRQFSATLAMRLLQMRWDYSVLCESISRILAGAEGITAPEDQKASMNSQLARAMEMLADVESELRFRDIPWIPEMDAIKAAHSYDRRFKCNQLN
jgi:hypothetical protein